VKMPRHPDFEKIYRAFMKRYCGSPEEECERGRRYYYAWLNKMGLDDTKPYEIPQEAFMWAAPLFTLLKKDEKAKYYRVEALFPTVSMNRNVYTEDELVRGARTLIGKPVNLNHEQSVHGVEIVDAEYEDGAVEVILRVENEDLIGKIDNGEILHVSIEASCRMRPVQMVDDEIGWGCEGLVFTGLALLTKNVLPGVPLTRILPVERLVESYQLMEEKEMDEKSFEELKQTLETAFNGLEKRFEALEQKINEFMTVVKEPEEKPEDDIQNEDQENKGEKAESGKAEEDKAEAGETEGDGSNEVKADGEELEEEASSDPEATAETVDETAEQETEKPEPEESKQEKPCICTKEGFWQRFHELRDQGLSQREAYKICFKEALEAIKKLQESKD